MSEFFNVLPPAEAQALMRQHLTTRMGDITLPTSAALGRVLAADITSHYPLPSFRRSTMDGYAVRAADTFGATPALPALSRVIGEVLMGEAAMVTLGVGEAAIVHTGGMLPDGSDGVVPVEQSQRTPREGAPPFDIEVMTAVAPGQNVIQVGEDVAMGELILPAGHKLRPQDLGGLLAVGHSNVKVCIQPRVAILATGDELIPPNETPQPGQIRDINSYTVAAQIIQAGGEPHLLGITPDKFSLLQQATQAALATYDIVVLSAGSSVSVRDLTVRVIESLGEPGVILHGIATRPGKPTIVGIAQGKLVLGLPGNPVSAMVQFHMLGTTAIHHLLGQTPPQWHQRVWATLSENVASESGREDYVPVVLTSTAAGMEARPVFGKSNLIYTLVRADGMLKVPLNQSGLMSGAQVEVELF